MAMSSQLEYFLHAFDKSYLLDYKHQYTDEILLQGHFARNIGDSFSKNPSCFPSTTLEWNDEHHNPFDKACVNIILNLLEKHLTSRYYDAGYSPNSPPIMVDVLIYEIQSPGDPDASSGFILRASAIKPDLDNPVFHTPLAKAIFGHSPFIYRTQHLNSILYESKKQMVLKTFADPSMKIRRYAHTHF